MAINRGPWNALVDDDGSNLVGSIWNKAAIKDVILDPTDAAILPAWTNVETTATGTNHNFNPGIVGHTTIILKSAGGITLTGFAPAAAPFNGQTIVLLNLVSAAVTLLHDNAGSAAGSRIQCYPATAVYTGFWATVELQYIYNSLYPGGWILRGNTGGY